jgi:hypothetical protein
MFDLSQIQKPMDFSEQEAAVDLLEVAECLAGEQSPASK